MPQTGHAARIRWANKELISKGNTEAVGDYFASRYVARLGGFEGKGPAFVRRFITQLHHAVPDVRVASIEILLESGDRVAWRRTLKGTHKRDLMGILASGKKITWCDMLVTRFNTQGKVAEEWVVSDLAGSMFEALEPG